MEEAPKNSKTLFKNKRNKPRGQIRLKNTKLSDEDGDEDDEVHFTLEDLRQEQEMRKRLGGVQAEVPNNQKKKVEVEEEVAMVGEDMEYGLKDKKQAKKDLEKLMEGQFTGQVVSKDKQQEIHEKLLESFINEKMGVKNEVQEVIKEISEEDKLYLLPLELRPKSVVQDFELVDNEAGAPIAYNTGIAEVALPMQFKLKNYEATEKLRKKLEESGKEEVDSLPAWMTASLDAPGNLTANYAAHKVQWMENLRLKQKLQVKHKQAPMQRDGPRGKHASTDDQVLERFKKRARGRY